MTGHLQASALLPAMVAIAGGVAFVGSLALGVVAYAVWFGRDAGPWSAAPGVPALAINAVLFSGFALHHSVFARIGMRRWMASRVSPGLERTVYVWFASVLFAAVCWAWRPVPGLAWQTPAPWSAVLTSVQVVGIWLSVQGARLLDVWDLSGLRQAVGRERPRDQALVSTGLYRLVRHPIYLGWTLMVWPAATMTGTRLAFAALSTAYLLIAIPIEERTLRRDYGDTYEAYARQVRWRVLPFVY